MNELVSVIVPIYNTEKYLEKCIKSILAQTHANIEVVLVNDGSTDHSGAIIDTYAQRDNRIVVINKSNGGLSDARNAGIEKCSGDYITFIDADDFVSPNYVEVLLNTLNDENADLVLCEFEIVNEEGASINYLSNGERTNKFVSKFPTISTSGTDIIYRSYIEKNGYKYIVAWNKIYKKEFFVNLRFPINLIHEDEHVFADVFIHAKKIAFVDIPLYYYVQRDSGIMAEKNAARSLKSLSIVHAHRKNLFKDKYEELYICDLKQYARQIIKGYHWLSPKEKEEYKTEYQNVLNELKNSGTRYIDRLPYKIAALFIKELSVVRVLLKTRRQNNER